MQNSSRLNLEQITDAQIGRSAWRQRVVEAERGFTAGFRANSALFFYFFTTSVLISISVVLGLSGVQWALLLLSVVIAISSELLCFTAQKLGEILDRRQDEEITRLISMVAAACFLLLAGSIATIVLILGLRLYELYG